VSRTLFVTRKFPPAVGGMETLAAETWRAIETEPGSRLVAHGGANRSLWRWVPPAALAVRRAVHRDEVDCVLTGDTLTAALFGPLLGQNRRPRLVSMAMGLDLTYDRWGYQHLARRGLAGCDLVLAISRSTAELAVGLGAAAARVEVIRLGVQAPKVTPAERVEARHRLDDRTGGHTVGHRVLGTLGRLVQRKGHRWFVTNVLPSLPDVHYVVAGDGAEATTIRAAAEAVDVADRVHLLGPVDDADREAVLRGVDVFVQPNVRVADDVEGFGLVAIEAAMRGTPVVAARIEGLADAVDHTHTGLLVEPADAAAWVSTLDELLSNGDALARLGLDWGARARARYSPEQFAAAVRAAVGLGSGS